MRRQRCILQIKEQEKNSEKPLHKRDKQPPEKNFKVMIINMLKELVEEWMDTVGISVGS